MSNHDGHVHEVKNPGPWHLSSAMGPLLFTFIVIGMAVIGIGLGSGHGHRIWANILTNFFYYLCIALGSVFFIALQYITSSMWSVPVRRVAEGFSKFLPWAFAIGLAILVLGGHFLYEWMHQDALQHDALLASKAGYLNTKFAIIRTVIAFLLWILIANKLVKNSVAQDANGDASFTLSNGKWSAFFIPVFAISFSLLSFDYMMSLEPHWFSTMFGVYCFAGLFYSTLCAITVVAIILKKKGLLTVLGPDHLHDLGKLIFGFSIFWAYIGFCQFMLIWYANLPEETVYYLRRAEGGWKTLAYAVLFTKFIIPFFMLMPREVKRRECFLKAMAIFMLVAHWFDVYVMVMPNFLKAGPAIGWMEVGTAVGFFGLFVFIVTRFYSRNPVLAYQDPRLHEALHHHQ